MAGYNMIEGMSNNAVEAYSNGERPMSAWNKRDILTEILNKIENADEYWQTNYPRVFNNVDFIKDFKLADLKKFLIKSSYHHTSKFYNTTDFYKIDGIDSIDDELSRIFNIEE